MWRPYQLQMTKMSTYFKCFCDLCAMRMVCFWPKSILVLIRFITFLLLLTTTNKYPPRGSDKHFFFTTSSWNVSIARHGVSNGNYPLFYFCEFSESHLGKNCIASVFMASLDFSPKHFAPPEVFTCTVDRFQEKSCYIHWTALRNQIIDYFSPFEITFNYTLNALWNSTSSSLQKKIKYQTGYMTTVKNTSFNMREVFFSKASLRLFELQFPSPFSCFHGKAQFSRCWFCFCTMSIQKALLFVFKQFVTTITCILPVQCQQLHTQR